MDPKVAGPKVAGPKVAGPKVVGPKAAGPKVIRANNWWNHKVADLKIWWTQKLLDPIIGRPKGGTLSAGSKVYFFTVQKSYAKFY